MAVIIPLVASVSTVKTVGNIVENITTTVDGRRGKSQWRAKYDSITKPFSSINLEVGVPPVGFNQYTYVRLIYTRLMGNPILAVHNTPTPNTIKRGRRQQNLHPPLDLNDWRVA